MITNGGRILDKPPQVVDLKRHGADTRGVSPPRCPGNLHMDLKNVI